MSTQTQPEIKVFICYAREDQTTAKRLYDDLKGTGVAPWMDTEDLLPGQNWKIIIPKVLRQSSYVLVLLSSRSLSKRGFVQKELKKALDLLDEFSPDDVFVIPVRLDECRPADERLQALHWVDLFKSYEEGLKFILQVLVSDRQHGIAPHLQGSSKKMPGAAPQESVKPLPEQDGQPEHVTQKQTNTREAGKDYFEHVGGSVYTGPVYIQHEVPKPEQAPTREVKKSTRVWTKIVIAIGICSILIGGILFRDRILPKPVPVVSLRSEPLRVSDDDALKVFGLQRDTASAGFTVLRPLEYIENSFEDQGEVVVDHATGLMWQKAGSEETLTYEEAKKYVEMLNQEQFAGYENWRLPTIPELMSLLEPEKQSNNLYINPIFEKKQRWCWSADTRITDEDLWESAWDVDFDFGNVFWYDLKDFYVRCVRFR